MVDFKQMGPVDPAKRQQRLKQLTKLQNGARFEYISSDADGLITGRYLDYVSEWCRYTWNKYGKVENRIFAKMDIDWTSHNG